MTKFLDFLAYGATIIGVTSYIPQIFRILTTKSAKDISFLTCLGMLTSGLLWLVYGYGISSFPIIFANSLVLILTLIIFMLKIFIDRKPPMRHPKTKDPKDI